jgi:hypothetical protein
MITVFKIPRTPRPKKEDKMTKTTKNSHLDWILLRNPIGRFTVFL